MLFNFSNDRMVADTLMRVLTSRDVGKLTIRRSVLSTFLQRRSGYWLRTSVWMRAVDLCVVQGWLECSEAGRHITLRPSGTWHEFPWAQT